MATIVEISLSNDRDFFILPRPYGKETPLSMDNMGPVELDLDLMTQQDRNCILFNVSCGRFISNTKLEVLAPTHSSESEPVSTPAASPVKKVDPVKNQTDRNKKLVPILKGTVAEVKPRIEKVQTVKELKTLITAEKRGRKRKSILSAIDSRIKELSAEITNAIETGPSVNIPRRMKGIGMERINDIIEEEFEEIEVRFGPVKEE